MSSAKKDTTRMLRLNRAVDQLNRKTPYGGITVRELAEKLEVSERQVYRDLNAIENDLGVPLKRQEDGRTVRVSLRHGYLPSLSPEKATVIFLSVLQQRGSALAGHLNEIKDALISTLFRYHYNPSKMAADRLQHRIHIVEECLADPQRTGEHFIKLVEAVRESHRVKLWYFTSHSGEETERVVEPYGLICKRQNWYLVGRCLTRGSTRVFRIDQIKDVLPYTSQRFEYPEGFSLQEYMAQSWGVINDGQLHRVRLKYSRRVAHLLKNMVYHHSQRLEEELPDGSVIVTFEICGLIEFRGWLIQWGDTVEVLEPEWLRREIQRFARRISDIYISD